ncbi:ATP-grasp domain-containing protein [Allokutzneria oryzae]|uniref:RimK family alpha-L-glutamate ligase n=1 Tax=Allokutzneria oryzae TaxID=1378989 RepID=A0ABV5ZTK3_9PSEU
MGGRVVVVASKWDRDSKLVAQRLMSKSVEVIRLDIEELSHSVVLELILDGTAGSRRQLLLRDTSRVIDLDSVASVWVRSPIDWTFSEDLLPWQRAFAAVETGNMVNALWESLDCFWMSRPSAIEAASWKGEQLQRARSMGLTIPKSLITTDPVAARRFAESCSGSVITKTLASGLGLEVVERASSSGSFPSGRNRDAPMAEKSNAADGVGFVPWLLQEHIDKRAMVRVIVVGDAVFAAEVRSRDRQIAPTASTRSDDEVSCEPVRLPATVAERCHAFVHSYGLTFGVVSMVQKGSGEYVFLENNPVGSFLYLQEQIPSLTIVEAVADCLMRASCS